MSPTRKMKNVNAPSPESVWESEGWITLTAASLRLRMRYQRTRDLALSGALGPVRVSPSRRYYLRRRDVDGYADARPPERQG